MLRDSSNAAPPAEVELAMFASELPHSALPASAKAAFDRLAFDFISVVIAGLRDAACVRAANAFGGLADFGGNPSASAFALGTCAHWFDWDDTDDTSHVHGGAVVFPALLAAAGLSESPQDAEPRAEAFFAAAVVGYDVACRIGGHLKNQGHRGWMPTGSGGAIGAAAAIARLAGLGAPELLSAMGIAAANAGISRQALADRANSKGVLAGVAAKSAVDAFTIARAGVEGAPHFLNGPYGLCALEGQGAQMQCSMGLGADLLIERVSVKPYPCCRSAHAVIDGVLEFRRISPADATGVSAIDVSAPPGVFERCGAPFRIGDNARLSAQFSIPYTAAVALRKGSLELEDFEERAVARNSSEWRQLIEAIRVRRDPEAASDVLAPVHIRLVGNAGIAERKVTALKGDPEKPLVIAEQQDKLRSAARGVLSEGEIVEVEGLILDLQHDGPRELIRWLHPRFAARARAVGA